MDSYAARVRALLSPRERKLFSRLSTPQRIQDYLDSLRINFEPHGDTDMSPRRVIWTKEAHCFEGAVLGAAVLAFHGQPPLLLDLRTLPHDQDHVVALFKQNGYWGALSKTNHSILRYRDPIYASVRELALSYFHEYILNDGSKTLRAYSRPFDLSKFDPKEWITTEEDIFWLAAALDDTRHFPAVPKKNLRMLRLASPIERKAVQVEEWRERRLPKRYGR